MLPLNQLKDRWLGLLTHSANSQYLDTVFDQLTQKYAEPSRTYHTLEHIAACLLHFDQVVEHLENPQAVELALWFHDVIYNPKRSDNEIKSAVYAKNVLEQTSLSPQTTVYISKLILLTQHPARPVMLDEQYLLDIDLSILGAPRNIFDAYESNIRQEYSHVPLFFYRRARKKLLISFMANKRIFTTEYFYRHYEAQARTNIEHAIARL